MYQCSALLALHYTTLEQLAITTQGLTEGVE